MYLSGHPRTTFILVGHRLGGMVAVQELLNDLGSPDYQAGSISLVLATAIQLLEAGFCYQAEVDADYHIPSKLNEALAPYDLCTHKRKPKRQLA